MATNNVNEAVQSNEIIDLHRAYLTAHECGFSRDLTLGTHSASDIAARLRGISGITAVLLTDKLNVELGDYIRSALIEAVSALAMDCANDLEHSQKRQEKERGQAPATQPA